MRKIMIDLDDTIVEGGYLEVLNEYLGTNYTYQDTTDYFVESLLPEGKLDEYLEYFYTNINVWLMVLLNAQNKGGNLKIY